MFKRVNISIDSDLNDLWGEVAHKHRITKSGMVEEYLRRILYQLNHINISDLEDHEFMNIIKGIDRRDKTLFDHDQSIEDYKEMKRTGEI